MSSKKIYSTLPFYNNLENQTRFNSLCYAVCDFKLLSTCDDVPAFQIKTDSFGIVQDWSLVYLDGQIDTVQDLATFTTPILASIGTTVLVSVAGYGTIASYVQDTTDENTVANLAYQINAGGVFTASASGNELSGIAPIGSGTGFNGTVWTVNKIVGIFTVGFSGIFSGAGDMTTGTEISIIGCKAFLNKYVTATDGTYVIYNGGDLAGCLPEQLVCGRWYIRISDETNTYYSEVFTVQSIEITQPIGIRPLLNIWPFYDNLQKQNRYKSICLAVCDFKLISPNTNLLPFEVKRNASANPILSWTLFAIDGSCFISLDKSLLSIVNIGSDDYIVYKGEALDNLECGEFYSEIVDSDNAWFSELITIVNSSDTANSGGLQTDDGIDILTDGGTQINID